MPVAVADRAVLALTEVGPAHVAKLRRLAATDAHRLGTAPDDAGDERVVEAAAAEDEPAGRLGGRSAQGRNSSASRAKRPCVFGRVGATRR